MMSGLFNLGGAALMGGMGGMGGGGQSFGSSANNYVTRQFNQANPSFIGPSY
jgi:hypothetical protein